jgi:hypothetical protein
MSPFKFGPEWPGQASQKNRVHKRSVRTSRTIYGPKNRNCSNWLQYRPDNPDNIRTGSQTCPSGRPLYRGGQADNGCFLGTLRASILGLTEAICSQSSHHPAARDGFRNFLPCRSAVAPTLSCSSMIEICRRVFLPRPRRPMAAAGPLSTSTEKELNHVFCR